MKREEENEKKRPWQNFFEVGNGRDKRGGRKMNEKKKVFPLILTTIGTLYKVQIN